jgi:N utilization substance protein A
VADVIVSEHQLSLAIGKEGQNARLAARLSGYKVDIRSDHVPEPVVEEAPAPGQVPPVEVPPVEETPVVPEAETDTAEEQVSVGVVAESEAPPEPAEEPGD